MWQNHDGYLIYIYITWLVPVTFLGSSLPSTLTENMLDLLTPCLSIWMKSINFDLL